MKKEELSNTAYQKDSAETANFERRNCKTAILESKELRVEFAILHEDVYERQEKRMFSRTFHFVPDTQSRGISKMKVYLNFSLKQGCIHY